MLSPRRQSQVHPLGGVKSGDQYVDLALQIQWRLIAVGREVLVEVSDPGAPLAARHLAVQVIEQVAGCPHEGSHPLRHVVRDEQIGPRVKNHQPRALDLHPDVQPRLTLGRSRRTHEPTLGCDVIAEDDLSVGVESDETPGRVAQDVVDQAAWLPVVDDDHSSTLESVLEEPRVVGNPCLVDALPRGSQLVLPIHVLERVVEAVLGDVERFG